MWYVMVVDGDEGRIICATFVDEETAQMDPVREAIQQFGNASAGRMNNVTRIMGPFESEADVFAEPMEDFEVGVGRDPEFSVWIAEPNDLAAQPALGKVYPLHGRLGPGARTAYAARNALEKYNLKTGDRVRGPVGEEGIVDVVSKDPDPMPGIYVIGDDDEIHGPYDPADLRRL